MANKTSKRRRKQGRKASRRSPQAGRGKVSPIHQPPSAGKRLSLCMIVKNEEKALPTCLESVEGLVDELIVVDTGSTDRTIEIAQRFGAKVYHFEWVDDFSAARNASIKHATGDWILWLDADDILPQKYHTTIRRLLTSPQDHAFYFRLENIGGDEAVCYQLRMFPNRPGLEYTMPVHEQVLPSLIRLGVGKMINVDVSVIHTGYTDAETIASKNAKYLTIMNRWLETHPHDYVTRSHVARIYHTEGRHTQAIEAYQTIINDSRCRLENELIYLTSLIYLGRSHLNLGQYTEALAAFEQTLQVDANYDIAYMCFGEAYTQMGEADEAIEFLEKIRDKGGIAVSFLPVEVKSLNYHCRHFLGKNYEQIDRPDEAIAEYHAAIGLDPRRTEAPTALAQLLANRGDLSGAHRVLDAAIQANPSEPEHYLNQVILYMDEQRYDEAEWALQTALQHDPTHSRAHLQRGRLDRLRGNTEAAELAYQKAIQYNPDAVEAHTDLGHLYIERKQFNQAERAFEAAIQVCQESGQEVALDIQLGYAYSCACGHKREKVTAVYHEVSRQMDGAPIATDGDVTNQWIDLGELLLESRLPGMAAYAMQTAKALNPNADRAVEGLGDVLMQTGKHTEAREHYENALQLAPKRLELFFKLGDCYLELDAKDVAQMCYQQGLEANPLLQPTMQSVTPD
ncbi:MAG: tetratricopeptide repeat protein [Candidatus Poribacteria bacterium]|nr:tetratricopeptide repeat protein [Candidatus Poribacteria bacterium]